jgi:hypothetical protein
MNTHTNAYIYTYMYIFVKDIRYGMITFHKHIVFILDYDLSDDLTYLHNDLYK